MLPNLSPIQGAVPGEPGVAGCIVENRGRREIRLFDPSPAPERCPLAAVQDLVEAPDRLDFDLPDAFAGQPDFRPDLLQGHRFTA